jgi:hypothetical protein
MLRTVLVGTAFVFGLVVAAVPAPEAPFGLRLQLVAEAYSQMDQTLFRRCRRAVPGISACRLHETLLSAPVL